MRSISVLTLFGWCTLQLDNIVQYDFLPFPFPFYFSSYLLLIRCQTFPQLLAERRFKHITLWEISVKALCCSKLQQLFHRLDPMFSTSHVFIILVEYLYQQLPEKGNLRGKTLQTLPSLKQFLLYHRKYSLTIDFKLETISFYNIKDIVPLSSSFYCCCSNVWSYSNPFPFSLPICKIFFVPWFRNFIMHLVKNYFIPWFWTFDMPF